MCLLFLMLSNCYRVGAVPKVRLNGQAYFKSILAWRINLLEHWQGQYFCCSGHVGCLGASGDEFLSLSQACASLQYAVDSDGRHGTFAVLDILEDDYFAG